MTRHIFIAFADMVTGLLTATTVLFALTFMEMNPDAHKADVKLQTQMLITLEWPSGSTTDLDLWVRGPDGTIVGYPHKDGVYMNLDRDNLGATKNMVVVNGQPVQAGGNVENVSVYRMIPGEYVVNVHFYHGDAAMETPTVTVVQLSPYRVVFKGKMPIVNQQEETFVSFTVQQDGTVTDINTQIQIPFRETLK